MLFIGHTCPNINNAGMCFIFTMTYVIVKIRKNEFVVLIVRFYLFIYCTIFLSPLIQKIRKTNIKEHALSHRQLMYVVAFLYSRFFASQQRRGNFVKLSRPYINRLFCAVAIGKFKYFTLTYTRRLYSSRESF